MRHVLMISSLLLGVTACSGMSPVGPSTSVKASTDFPAVTASHVVDAPVVAAPARFELDGRSQTVRGNVTIAADESWTITSEASWITVLTPSGGGPGSFSASVDANLCTSDPRTGQLRVMPGATIVTVWQDGSDLGVCP